MRRRLLSLGLVGVMAWSLSLAFAPPASPAAAQAPSPRPPLSATDQYLTSVAQPTQPPSGGGGGPAAPTVTLTETRPAATRAPASTATSSPTAPPPTSTPTPPPTQVPPTPVVIVQTVVQVQTVVVVATAAPSLTPPPTSTPAAVTGEVARTGGETPAWLLAVIAFPFVILGIGLWWLSGRDLGLPGLYPERGRPRRAGRLPGREHSS
jgi:hypothetical protein